MMIFCKILFALLLIKIENSELAEITDTDWNVFTYPGKARSERDLQQCNEREVCSIVHKRFFFPRQVERFCYCDSGECPSTWSDGLDNRTMTLNNRAQLKFCEPVTQLPVCNRTLYLHVNNSTRENNSQINSKAECHCLLHNEWIESYQLRNSSSSPIQRAYRCSSLDKCKPDEQCGWERTDHYETYYTCSCPTSYLCIRRNDSTYDVSQLFYSGPAYKTFCTKFTNNFLNLDTN